MNSRNCKRILDVLLNVGTLLLLIAQDALIKVQALSLLMRAIGSIEVENYKDIHMKADVETNLGA
ncbi:hypothetical protein OnM2_03070 [Erysiphe neolycopersici]|uniref:Uncharacterized protein n=1 Tax=Erysiphe neolycopersici TaxID=212602 RepID=A0A420HPC1_9PEZI|nr:hypothetical protein OnM2_03070 [Erysiphe neolycopersici]